MHRSFKGRRPAAVRLAAIGPLIVVGLALGGGLAGCAGAGAPAAADVAPVPTAAGPAEVPAGDMPMPTAEEVASTWASRPAWLLELPDDWQQAYAYALARPDVLQWLPCYCGCGGMGHRSNLDCFFQRREVAGTFAFEEHASYCEICVETANLAARMLREGRTMPEIRAAVDGEFGGRAPGTDTALPPA